MAETSEKKKKRRRRFGSVFMRQSFYFDYPTLFLVIFLTVFGLMMAFSASAFFVSNRDTISFSDFWKQVIYAGVGFILLFIASRVNYRIYRKLDWIVMGILFLLLVFVMIFGESENGSTRWLNIFGIQFQPSELAKPILAVHMAHICGSKGKTLEKLKSTLVDFLAPAIIIVIIALQNLSTAIICAAIVGVIWIVATPRLRYLAIFVVIAGALIAAAVKLKDYRSGRFRGWSDPEENATEEGYQVLQSLYAVSSGGLFGRGLGQSVQKQGKLPEAQNDMIFSVICEELGIVGGIGVIIVFCMLIWRLAFIATGAPDRFGALMVCGILTHIAFQALVNIAVSMNVIPNTGVPLPFISRGGTSLIATLGEIGMVLSVSRQIVPESRTKEELLYREKRRKNIERRKSRRAAE